MKIILEENSDLQLLMRDEAHFDLDAVVNKQNFRYWAPENSRNIYEPTSSFCHRVVCCWPYLH